MAGTRWLSADEQRTWRTFMLATKLLWEQLDRELDQKTQVPSAYYEVLVRLSEAPERRLRMGDLADLSQSSRSRLSHSMARLEALGWIRRESCPTDRRGAFAVLTDEGFAALAAAAPVHVEGVRTHLFDQLDPAQLEELRRISEQMLEHLVAVKGSSSEDLGVLGVLGRCPTTGHHEVGGNREGSAAARRGQEGPGAARRPQGPQ
ncbi:MAG TPA: MarR family transcriptional regulator [Acidimicrobiales bacterium]|nr:MarR family transcriptional regulator [Acidimicrobiales bacterium]